MLKPQPPAKPSIELLAQAPTMDNNRLEKLVKNFVVEDKARLAARNKTMPSSIQYALQKFEKKSQNSEPDSFIKKTTNVSSTPSRTNNYTSAIPSPSPSLVSQQKNLFKICHIVLCKVLKSKISALKMVSTMLFVILIFVTRASNS